VFYYLHKSCLIAQYQSSSIIVEGFFILGKDLIRHINGLFRE